MEQKNSGVHRGMRFVMGTFWEIEVGGVAESEAVSAVETAFSEINRLDRLLSRFRTGSDIGQINASPAGIPVQISREVFDLLQLAFQHTALTNGAFDITSGALSSLWKSAEERGSMPTADELEHARLCVGSENILLNPTDNTVARTKDGVILDLSAIGKGYAMDCAVHLLQVQGIQDAMINAGGAIHIVDNHQGKRSSTIGIRNPQEPDALLATVDLGNEAISTSAAYERFYAVGGKKYGHIMSRELRSPSENILSVSVISKSSTVADIYSTAMYVAGLEESRKFLSQQDDIVGALFIVEDAAGGMRLDALGNISVSRKP